ncbi:hypothetical protein [Paenibacillus koleovorans]|uniref:hypothetical protein n=1 Tax=Paenibacillus koleovorans TaxID=121608 RepID=UPI000FD940FE|nr:hypothetical protein [Paenibacillus koleovorans]
MNIYEAHPECKKHVKQAKDSAYAACCQYVNRYVRVQRMNGETLEGHIVHVDAEYVYLQLPSDRAFYNYYNPYYYNNTVLPLVLFDLLAITLLL